MVVVSGNQLRRKDPPQDLHVGALVENTMLYGQRAKSECKRNVYSAYKVFILFDFRILYGSLITCRHQCCTITSRIS